jgi:sporulation protein YlmC with PRC-barrel domain
MLAIDARQMIEYAGKDAWMNVEKLKGMAVVSVDEGSKLGQVDGALFDPASLRLTALQLKGDNGAFIVPLDRVSAIGADAITVESSQATQTATSSPQGTLIELSDLKKRKVVTADGTLLGTVNDLDIDPISGQLNTLSAHKGGLLGLGGETTTIEAAAIKNIGEIITVVN